MRARVAGRRAQGVSRGGHAGTRAASRWDMRVERSEVRERRGIVRVRDVQRGAEGTRAGAQVGEGRSLGLCYCIVAVWRHGTRAAARFLARRVLCRSRGLGCRDGSLSERCESSLVVRAIKKAVRTHLKAALRESGGADRFLPPMWDT